MTEVTAIRTKGTPQADFSSIEAEQQVLGALLGNNDLFPKISDILRPEHFFDPVHARLFEHIAARVPAGHLASPITVKAEMGGDPGIAELGGWSYLARLVGAATATFAIRDYADLVIDAANRRALAEAIRAAEGGLSASAPLPDILLGLQTASGALAGGGKPASVSLLMAAAHAVERMNAAYQGDAPLLKTGIGALDDLTGGIDVSDLVLLGGTSSMGKTATALEITRNVASTGGLVIVVSREMTEVQLASRIISSDSKIKYSDMRKAETMTEADFRKVVESAQKVGDLPIRIVAGGANHIKAVEAAIMRTIHEAGAKPKLVVVDYAQLLTADGRTQTERMVGVADWLKDVTKRLGCPVLALVQVDRNIGERQDKRPQMTDIRETGQFENNADMIVFCHREEYWLEKTGPQPDKSGNITDEARATHDMAKARAKNQIELIVRKQRSGETGIALVGCHIATNRFWRLSDDQPF